MSVANAVFLGLGIFTGIDKHEPLGKLMRSDFPNVPTSFVHGRYEFDTVISALWLKAGELTDEIDDILSKPVSLEILNKLKLSANKTEITTSQKSEEIKSNLQKMARLKSKVEISRANNVNSKKVSSGLYGILLGTFGIHKFILGYTKTGYIMLLISLISIFTLQFAAIIMMIIGFIEGIIYLVKSDDDFEKTYIKNKKEWF